ncbi:MAG: hypothetical protein H6Q04_3063, partial [Acidobacteria bacterium]|nr:hypothetical protein [Acidobacteriota bacterium]
MRTRTAYKLTFTLLCLSLFAHVMEAGDKVVSEEFITEPPTLIALGFEWRIGGD